jgi:hypothetical protein
MYTKTFPFNPLLCMALLALWTLLLIRVGAARATLSRRTFLLFLLQGAFLGTIGMRLIQRLFDPTGLWIHNPWITFLVTLSWMLSLLAPVRILLTGRMSRMTSVADAFLLAFAIGFGFDLCGALLAASMALHPLKGLWLFPPWQFTGDMIWYSTADSGSPPFIQHLVFAGYGYWAGLAALVRAATLRFVRKPRLSWCIQGAVLLWVVADAAVATMSVELAPWGAMAHYLGVITLHGRFTA